MVDQQATDRRKGQDRRTYDDRRRVPERRSGVDRRQISPDKMIAAAVRAGNHPFVERRSGLDRRSGDDNRIGIDRRSGIDRRVGIGWRDATLGERLSPESALELVSDFYSASMDTRFWPTALSKLRDALNASGCGLAEHDFASGKGRLDHAIGFDIDSLESFGSHYADTSEWLHHEEPFRMPGTVLADTDILDEESALASEFSVHWLAPQGFEHQLFGILDRQGVKLLYIYAVRAADDRPFDDAEKTLLRRLLPYMQRGLRAGQVLHRTQNVRQVALDALDAMPVGIALISTSGSVLAANRVARDTMSSREVLSIGRSGLELNKEGRRTLFRDLISQAGKKRGGNMQAGSMAFSVSRPSGQRGLSILIWPISTGVKPLGWEDPAAIVFVGDPDRPAEIDESRLRALYGLTNAEARVAALLGRGYRLDEIADMLGVAYETTRKHLKKVLAKMETDRQADLVRTIVTGPGGLNL